LESASPRPIQPLSGSTPWLKVLLDSGNSFSRPNAIVKIWIIYNFSVPTADSVSSFKSTIFNKWADIDTLLCGAGREKDIEPGQNGSHAYERLKEVKLLNNRVESEVVLAFLKQWVLNSPGLEKRGILNTGSKHG